MKIIAIASAGGHWIQLMRLKPALEEATELIFISTEASFASTVKAHKFYTVLDANRWNKWRLLQMGWQIRKIIKKEKPDVVISTGAAPGLMGLAAARLTGAKTIWVDSIANVEKLSLSGKIASKFTTRTYTQWPQLATSDIRFKGNVLS